MLMDQHVVIHPALLAVIACGQAMKAPSARSERSHAPILELLS
jgi:hypothetical protein